MLVASFSSGFSAYYVDILSSFLLWLLSSCFRSAKVCDFDSFFVDADLRSFCTDGDFSRCDLVCLLNWYNLSSTFTLPYSGVFDLTISIDFLDKVGLKVLTFLWLLSKYSSKSLS